MPSRAPHYLFPALALGLMLPFSVLKAASDAGVQLEQQKALNPSLRPPAYLPEQDTAVPEAKTSINNDTPVRVNQFRLEGEITVFDAESLLAPLREYEGQTLTVSRLFELASELTERYREQGYFLARVFLPPQDVTDGIIRLRVVEGRRDTAEDGIQLNHDEVRLDPTRARKLIAAAIPAERAMRKQDLERAVLLLRDLPGMGASATLAPGSVTGTTRIMAELNEGPIFNPWLGLDNGGSRITGEYRVTAGADINNPFGQGEQFTLYSAKSLGSGDMQFISAGYNQPLGDHGLKAGLGVDYLTYESGKEFASSDSRGEAYSLNLNLNYPWLRSRKTSLFVHGEVDIKSLQDEALGQTVNEKQLTVVRLGLNGSHADGLLLGGFTSAQLRLHSGQLDLQLPAVKAADQALTGAGTDGGFEKLSWQVRRVQRNLPDMFLIGDWSGQLAANNLDSSEKFRLGGPYGVRAYPVGEALGDNGMKLSLEAHYVFGGATRWGDLRLIGFYDWGWVEQYSDLRQIDLDTPAEYELSGYGLGINIGRPGEVDFNLFWARRIGDNPGRSPLTGLDQDGSQEKNRIWLSLNAHF